MKLRLIVGFLMAVAAASLSCSRGTDSGVQLPELTAFDATLEEQVQQIAAQTSYMRGLEFPGGLDQGTLTRAQITEYNELASVEAREESEDEIAAYNTVFRLLHMIGPKDDLLDIVTSYQVGPRARLLLD